MVPLHADVHPRLHLALYVFHCADGRYRHGLSELQPQQGLVGSDWVGLQHFEFLWAIPDAKRALWNTLIIAISKVILNIVIPMAFALMLNEIKT